MRLAQPQAYPSTLTFNRRARTRPPGRGRVCWVAGMCDIRVHLAMEQNERAAGRSDTRSAISGGERGKSRPGARLVSDVSGSLQVCLGISTGGAHLILMSQVRGLHLVTRPRPPEAGMQTESITTVRGWTMPKLAHAAAVAGTAATGGSCSG